MDGVVLREVLLPMRVDEPCAAPVVPGASLRYRGYFKCEDIFLLEAPFFWPDVLEEDIVCVFVDGG